MKGSTSTGLIRPRWKKLSLPDDKLQGCNEAMTTGSHDRKQNLSHRNWWKITVGGNSFEQCERPSDYVCVCRILVNGCAVKVTNKVDCLEVTAGAGFQETIVAWSVW